MNTHQIEHAHTRRNILGHTLCATAALAVLPSGTNHSAEAMPSTAVDTTGQAEMPELLIRYSAWLDAERHALMLEMYPGCDPVECARFVPADPFANRWWWFTPPSGRVLAVLSAAGIYTGPDTAEARALAWERRV